MKVFGLHNNGYFEEGNDCVEITDGMYQGMYNYTPVYPLYTFSVSGRFNYLNMQPEIEFNTMLPIERVFTKCFVEVKFRFMVEPRQVDSLNIAISEFHKFCEMNTKELNVSTLFKKQTLTNK